jgi:nicotinamidase-related amidase
MLELDPKTTALVLIDLQKGIMGHALKPYPADQVTKAGSTLADTFRKAGAPVVLVNVGFAKDFKDALRQPVDQPSPHRRAAFPKISAS